MDTNVTTPRPARRALPPLMALTDTAAERLRSLYAKGQQGKLLRIGVGTKGCSGLSYQMSWVDAPGPGDEVVKDKDVTVLVDRKAADHRNWSIGVAAMSAKPAARSVAASRASVAGLQLT
jgi:iron-sulfur cluster assembly protein